MDLGHRTLFIIREEIETICSVSDEKRYSLMFRILDRKTYCVLFLFFSMSMISIYSHALTPYQLMAKAAKCYQSLHTFQAVYYVQVDTQQLGSSVSNMIIKTIPSSGKFYVKTVTSLKKSGRIGVADTFTINYGKNIIMFNPVMNTYMILPQYSTTTFHNMLSFYGMEMSNNQLIMMKNVKMKFLTRSSVEGHPVYVIQLKEQIKPHIPPTTIRIYLDKKTSWVIRRVAGSDMGFMNMNISMSLISYKVNAPIPASIFHFVLPKGAKLLQP